MPLWLSIGIGLISAIAALPLLLAFWPKQGKWAINLRPLVCSVCQTPSPQIRKPRSKRELLWGGWICQQCGTALDKFGHKVANDE